MAYGVGYPNYPNQQYGGPVPQQYVPSYPQQPQQNSGGIIWVNGEAGAKSFLVGPNQTVQLWDTEDQIIYLKSADASGMPSIKIIDYTIREQSTQNNQSSEYVTKSDFEEFSNKIMKQIEEMNNYRYNKYNKHPNGNKGDNNG